MKNFWKDIASTEVEIKAGFVKPDTEAVRPRVTSVKVLGASPTWKMFETREVEVEMAIDDSNDPSMSRLPSELDMHLDIAVSGKRRRVVVNAEILVTVSAESAGSDITKIPLEGLPNARFDFLPIDENLYDKPTKRDYLLTSHQQEK